jgi:hypothetical protein
MGILVMILWYLQLFTTSTSYTTDQMNALISQNKTAIQAVQNDPVMMKQVQSTYQATTDPTTKKVIEEWGVPLPQPILE